MPDMDQLVCEAYALHTTNPLFHDRIEQTLQSLSIPGKISSENVGRCASLINLYFDLDFPKKRYYEIFQTYVHAFHGFVRTKRIVDEQQWTAFVHILTTVYDYVDVDPDLFPLIRDVMVYERTPPFWNSDKTRIQVLTLQCMFDRETICLS
jgi:hypothetical protein